MFSLIILFAVIMVILGFLLDAWVLNLVAKKFKIANVSYKKTLIISIIQRIISFVAAIILSLLLIALNSKLLVYTLAIVVGFFIFHKIFNKYYKTSKKDSLKIYVIYQVVSVILISIFSLAIIIPTRSFVFQPFYIEGSAMSPTLNNHDYTIFKLFDKNYQRGDVIAHKDPRGGENLLIKRIIGLPGEKVQIKDGKVYIYNNSAPNGQAINEPYLSSEIKTYALDENMVSIGDNQYYVLGDNRANSADSRIYGLVDQGLIIGKYWFMGLKN